MATLDRDDDHTMYATLGGYAPLAMDLERKMGGATFGNILVGGLIGVGVDAITGAAHRIDPDNIHIIFESSGSAEPTRAVDPKRHSTVYAPKMEDDQASSLAATSSPPATTRKPSQARQGMPPSRANADGSPYNVGGG